MGDDGICKHNQTGYYKFRETCIKVHDNQICNTKGCDPSVESATPKKANILQCKSFANVEEAVASIILKVLKVSKKNSYMKT